MAASKSMRNKKERVIKIFFIIAAITLTLYCAVRNYIKHYITFHSSPIEIRDADVTKLLITYNISSIVWHIIFIIITVFVCAYIIFDSVKERRKSKINRNKEGNKPGGRRRAAGLALAVAVKLLIMILMSWFLIYLCRGLILRIPIAADNKISAEDWDISVQTVDKMGSRQSGKIREYYVILRESGKKQPVRSAQYAVYISENEDIYLVEDKQHGISMILSPKQYRYMGEKLDRGQKLNYTPITNRYYLRFAIFFTAAFIIEILVLCIKIRGRRKARYPSTDLKTDSRR